MHQIENAHSNLVVTHSRTLLLGDNQRCEWRCIFFILYSLLLLFTCVSPFIQQIVTSHLLRGKRGHGKSCPLRPRGESHKTPDFHLQVRKKGHPTDMVGVGHRCQLMASSRSTAQMARGTSPCSQTVWLGAGSSGKTGRLKIAKVIRKRATVVFFFKISLFLNFLYCSSRKK